ncbi:MAG TPA: hypothetical protein VIK91_16065 [Nannocystis sp.]
MATVRVITTGSMEERALHRSLQAIFPEHTFVPHPRLDGFTSATLPPDYADLAKRPRPPINLDKFVGTIIGLFAPGRRQDRPRPDFVLAVEDLELVNAAAPENVIGSVRSAFERKLESWPVDGPARRRLVETVRERCSFHLMAPMTEAYFFADAQALARATHPGPDHPVQFDAATRDIEAFEVDDSNYLDARHDPAIAWCTDNRARHPKHYLRYLTDPQLDGKHRYNELGPGVAALETLAWSEVVRTDTRPATHARFARSLLADLHDMLGIAHDAQPAPPEPAHCHPLTWPPPASPVLRNL